MIAVRRRLTALAFGSVLADGLTVATAWAFPASPLGLYVYFATNWLWPDTQTLLNRRAPLVHEDALEELLTPGMPYWAGVYRSKGKWPHELVLAPQSGFTLYANDRCGTCEGWRSVGTVVDASGYRLTLDVELHDAGDNFQLDETLYLVKWGDLMFAVPESRMTMFCAAANDGAKFPDSPFRVVGTPSAFDPEEPTRPSGFPLVPAEFQHLIRR